MRKWYENLVAGPTSKISPDIGYVPKKKVGRIRKTWDIFFIEIRSLLLVNLLMAVGFAPFLVICVLAFSAVMSGLAGIEVVNNLGLGWPFLRPSTEPLVYYLAAARTVIYWIPFAFLALLAGGPLFAGAFKVSAHLQWGHTNVNVFKLFLSALKKHWWKYAAAFAVLVVIMFGAAYSTAHLVYYTLSGANATGFWALSIILWILVVLAVTVLGHLFTIIPTYEDMSFTVALKNSVFFCVGNAPFCFVIAFLSVAGFLFLLIQNPIVPVVLFIAFIAFYPALVSLVWTGYTQGTYEAILDKIYELDLANPKTKKDAKVKNAKGVKPQPGKKINNKPAQSNNAQKTNTTNAVGNDNTQGNQNRRNPQSKKPNVYKNPKKGKKK